MKAIRIIPIMLAVLAIAGCHSNKRMAYDDVYYSPYNPPRSQQADRTVTPSISSSGTYDYQAYYSDNRNYATVADPVYQSTETVTDTNGVVYTTTETYYDADFAARIKRFGSGASSTMDYYDDYYTGSGYSGGTTYVYVGDTWNWGFYPYTYPYYYGYYNPWYYDYYWYRPYYWYGYHWAWYDHYWYHPHHHHHHHHHFDHYGHGHGHGPGHGHGHGPGGIGGGHNDFTNYVATVRRNNTPGSMSYRTPQNNDPRRNGAGVSGRTGDSSSAQQLNELSPISFRFCGNTHFSRL